MRSLLIEDNCAIASCIRKALAAAHIVCDVTDLGEEGVELARLYQYDVILLDLALPDLGGLEVLRRIRQGRLDTPIIIVSAAAETDRKIEALKLGAADYVSKHGLRAEQLGDLGAEIGVGDPAIGVEDAPIDHPRQVVHDAPQQRVRIRRRRTIAIPVGHTGLDLVYINRTSPHDPTPDYTSSRCNP